MKQATKPMQPATEVRPLLLVFSSLALLLAGAACGTPGRAGLRSTDSAAPAPEAARIAEDVRWLAADEREGRRAGTSGEAESARYLADRLATLGLEPAGTQDFLQPFEVPLPVEDGGGSRLEVCEGDQRQVVEAPDLVPLFCSAGAKVGGPLVFAGYGISDADLGRDDYAGLDVHEAVVLIVRGTPPDALLPSSAPAEPQPGAPAANPHGAAQPTSSGWGGAGAVFYKVMEAKRRGAAAVVVVQHPGKDEPMLAFAEGGGAEAKFPALHLSAAAAERLLPGYGEQVARLDAGEKAARLGAGSIALATADVVRARGSAQNVLGLLRGTSSAHTLVIGAHFDHLGRGGSGSLAPKEQGQVHNGADDNASGTATVLELARCLAGGPKPAHDILFALWSGEELGLLGSEHWVRHPTVPLAMVLADLNLDMVGRAGNGKLSVIGAATCKQFPTWLALAGPAVGLELAVSLTGPDVGGSDHQTFHKREIPALQFFSGLHSDYHKPSDDFERFEAAGAERVAALVLELVRDLGTVDALAWIPPAKSDTPSPGAFKTRFGSIPDYVFNGTGMRLDGTSPGGPAEKAGLLRGDVIVGVGDQKIDGLGDFMFALNSHKPGDVVRVTFLRDGAEETCQVTLESSQVE